MNSLEHAWWNIMRFSVCRIFESAFVCNLVHRPTNKQTDKQTNEGENITSFRMPIPSEVIDEYKNGYYHRRRRR